MNKLFSRMSFGLLLTFVALVPLTAVTGFGAILAWESWSDYKAVERADGLKNMALAANNVISAIPVETTAKPENLEAARKNTDKVEDDFMATYAKLKESGHSSEGLDKVVANFEEKFKGLALFRTALDAKDNEQVLGIKYLSPIGEAGYQVIAKIGSMIEHPALSRSVNSLYSLIRANNNYFVGDIFLKNFAQKRPWGPAEAMQYARMLDSARQFEAQFKLYAAPEFASQFDTFWQTPEGKYLQEKYAKYNHWTPDMTSDITAPEIGKAMGAQFGFSTKLVQQTAADISAKSAALAETALTKLRVVLGGLGLLFVLVVAFVIGVARHLSSIIHRVAARMATLADGDTSDNIAYQERKDAVGAIARSVEVFRKATIRNEELEREAQEVRKRSEAERAAMQAEAAAEAEARLNDATSTLATNLRRLAEGDMMCEINEPLVPQLEQLRSDFNTSVRQLREVLSDVGSTVTTVAGGSNEISSASDNLAKRTENQAASLEETAAALDEVTENVRSTTDRTNEAREIVREASGRATKSSEVVNHAIEAMQRIESSSQQINQIIGVIDEIAFQTNLLALNAGVEAARAGEAGKGFAVVAQEVRELAQRSANAAKEIKELISNSAVAVGEGVQLVNDTGSGLTSIAELVTTVNAHMDAISLAAEEQSQGLVAVNQAINQMDQATQQNAAMVEEMNAAGAGLAGESQKLAAVLSRFQLGASTSALRATAEQMRQTPAVRQAPTQAVKEAPVRKAVSSGNTAAAEAPASWEEF